MILAAGLTPAWQQIMRFDEFTPGEVNRTDECVRLASGKVLNVGIAAHQLGGPARTLSIVGGRTGDAIRNEFRDAGFDARWVYSNTTTRVCTTILDSSSGRATELIENAAAVSASEVEAFFDAYVDEAQNANVVVLSGSLPAGVDVGLYRRMLEATPCRAVLDVQGSELAAALERRPYVVKPNRSELSVTVGRPLRDRDAVLSAMEEVRKRGAGWVVVTDGPGPVYAIGPDGAFQINPPAVDVVNPIGCGDATAAGMAWALADGRSVVDAVLIGVAAATDNLSRITPARLDRDAVLDAASGLPAARI